jgi:membrane protease YdiL (CAAX protease family)
LILLALLFNGIVLVPLFEEWIFRFGLLQVLLRISAGPRLAVLFSSLVFAVLHLRRGGSWTTDFTTLRHAVWLFAFSIVLAHQTLRRGGNPTQAVVAHCSYNAVSWLLLTFVAVAASR